MPLLWMSLFLPRDFDRRIPPGRHRVSPLPRGDGFPQVPLHPLSPALEYQRRAVLLSLPAPQSFKELHRVVEASEENQQRSGVLRRGATETDLDATFAGLRTKPAHGPFPSARPPRKCFRRTVRHFVLRFI